MLSLRFIFLSLFFLLLTACGDAPAPASQASQNSTATQHPGQALHAMYCVACHALPQPEDLDKATWRDAILVRMGAYMGIYNDNVRYYDSVPAKWLEPGIGGQRVMAAGIYPATPMLSRQDWEQIRDYILTTAPEKAISSTENLAIAPQTSRFKARFIQPDTNLNPLVTAIAIDEKAQRLYAGFLQQGMIQADFAGKLREYYAAFYGPVHIRVEEGRLSIADIGSIKGSDNPKGKFMAIRGMEDLKQKRPPVLQMDALQRPVFSEWADLDQDGDEDLVLCEFGYHLGELAWHENLGGGNWERHTLYPDDGTVSVGVHDFNGDGRPDILALMANSDEGVSLFLNQGDGKFQQKRLLRFNPTYGSAALELVDFDQDGKMDFLVSNGDNGDYKPIPKANHGIRLYRNAGDLKFEEAFFLPLNGAYGTRTRDYDLDGDLDIAAVAFYPDYSREGEAEFVYFEHAAPNSFSPQTFAGVDKGRWMVMDAGDIDGDGDVDLALGAFNVKSSDASEKTYQHWMQAKAPIAILENLTK